MPIEKIEAAEPPPPCQHLVDLEGPGEAYCRLCDAQIPWLGSQRTRWQRFTAWVAWWWVFLMADNNSMTLPASHTDSADPQE